MRCVKIERQDGTRRGRVRARKGRKLWPRSSCWAPGSAAYRRPMNCTRHSGKQPTSPLFPRSLAAFLSSSSIRTISAFETATTSTALAVAFAWTSARSANRLEEVRITLRCPSGHPMCLRAGQRSASKRALGTASSPAPLAIAYIVQCCVMSKPGCVSSFLPQGHSAERRGSVRRMSALGRRCRLRGSVTLDDQRAGPGFPSEDS